MYHGFSDSNGGLKLPGSKFSNASNQFSPGMITIPYTLSNDTNYWLDDTLIIELGGRELIQKAVTLPPYSSLDEIMELFLDTGHFQLNWILGNETGSYEFDVVADNNIELNLEFLKQGMDKVLSALIENNGQIPFMGKIQVIGQGISNSKIIELGSGSTQQLKWALPKGIPSGHHLLTVNLMTIDDQMINSREIGYSTEPAEIVITSLPSEPVGIAGEFIELAFGVVNRGDEGGLAEIAIDAGDLIKMTKSVWLDSGESKKLEFKYQIPPDLPPGKYPLIYRLAGFQDNFLEFEVTGNEFSFHAGLDQLMYYQDEKAIIKISITLPETAGSNLNKIRATSLFGDEKSEKWLELEPGKTTLESMTFTVDFSSDKVFYGLYTTTGRALILGDLPVRRRYDDFYAIPIENSVRPGEVGHLEVYSDKQTTLRIDGPGIKGLFEVGPEKQRIAYTVPEQLIEGTYDVIYAKGDRSRTVGLDIAGETVRVVNAWYDHTNNQVNAPGSSIGLHLDLIPTDASELRIETYLEPPFKNRIESGIKNVKVEPGKRNLVTVESKLDTVIAGTSDLYYEIYWHDQLVTGGKVLVEIGVGKLVSVNLSPHQVTLKDNEALVQLETYGTGSAKLELNLNGELFHEELIELNGFQRWEYYVPVENLPPGMHYVQGALYLEDCVSDKADWFEMLKISQEELADKSPQTHGIADDQSSAPGKDDVDNISRLSETSSPREYKPTALDGFDDVAHPGPTPTAIAEILSIPSLNILGIVLLILSLGACLARVGRRR